ncbi:MAG: cobalamin biosynthesis protein P47K, partial [Planctomycetaceae bacterium]|nr:cobalamin biosynthesis protein P47K [Planctomycetaceae bacterium]
MINRIDELAPQHVDELQSLIEAEYPGRPVLRCSARSGEGMDSLIAMLEQRGSFGQRVMEVDYDVYAEGEAELGWLN